MGYRADELVKRITEFQLVEGPDRTLIGAAALEILERHGRIHSEGFVDFSLADHARPLLWERFRSLAQNHGLLSLSTQEQAPFWARCGLVKADPETVATLPSPWKRLPGRWLTLKLRDDIEAVLAADQQFEFFMQQEKARTARTFQHARALKFLATLLAVGIFAAVVIGAFYLLRHNPGFRSR